jgi:hypothetical protein
MDLHDFGLWFRGIDWRTTIPSPSSGMGFTIYYDGCVLGAYFGSARRGLNATPLNGVINIYTSKYTTHIIRLKKQFPEVHGGFLIGRQLTMDDFEIVENPFYEYEDYL